MTEDILICMIEAYKNTPDSERHKKKALLEKTVAGLGEFLYTHLRQFKLDYVTEDIRSDFIVALYPRFEKIITQFDAHKASFKTYLCSVVRLSYRTFTRNRYGYEARQKVYESEEATRLLCIESERFETPGGYSLVHEEEVAYVVNKTLGEAHKMSKKKKEIHARKIFLFACKSGSFLDDTSIAQISEFSGYTENYIKTKLDVVRNECHRKNEATKLTVEKQNGYYIRSRRCLYEMKYLDKTSTRYNSLEKEYRYCIKRWIIIRMQISKQSRSPSNRYLSVTLGLSRGTIDKTLALQAKHRYSRIS